MPNKISNNINISIFLQARIDSTRLPGKIFFNLCEKSILKHMIERIKKLKKYYNYLVILVPYNDTEKIQSHLQEYPEVIVFPGDPQNVLKRFYDANKKINANIIIRITGDDPLIDIFHLKKALFFHVRNNADYSYYNNLPLGTGFEIINHKTLNLTYKKSFESYHFEHVTPYIRENPDLFNIQVLKAKGIYNNPDLRLTVDEKDDFKLMEIIYNKFYKGKPIILRHVLKFLAQNPEYQKINAHIKQKEMYPLIIK